MIPLTSWCHIEIYWNLVWTVAFGSFFFFLFFFSFKTTRCDLVEHVCLLSRTDTLCDSTMITCRLGSVSFSSSCCKLKLVHRTSAWTLPPRALPGKRRGERESKINTTPDVLPSQCARTKRLSLLTCSSNNTTVKLLMISFHFFFKEKDVRKWDNLFLLIYFVIFL